jgi:hypothetical protein
MTTAIDLDTTERARMGKRARTVSMKRMSARALEALSKETSALAETDPLPPRPRTFAECKARGIGTAESPCGYASCKWNLLVDVSEKTGAIKMNFPTVDGQEPDVDAMTETCALRVIQSSPDGLTLEEVGVITNLTRERVRQIETKGLAAVSRLAALAKAVDDEIDDHETHVAASTIADAMEALALDAPRAAVREVETGDVTKMVARSYARIAERDRKARRNSSKPRVTARKRPLLWGRTASVGMMAGSASIGADGVESLCESVSFGVGESL